jgi:hypothetical protein
MVQIYEYSKYFHEFLNALCNKKSYTSVILEVFLRSKADMD